MPRLPELTSELASKQLLGPPPDLLSERRLGLPHERTSGLTFEPAPKQLPGPAPGFASELSYGFDSENG